MLHLETLANPAVFVVILACVLSLGFMVRFLAALTLDGRTMRARHIRPEGVHYAADVPCVEAPFRPTALASAARLAIGVVRITTALASNVGLTSRQASMNQFHLVTPARPRQELDFIAEHHHRAG